jgi:NADH-quinone oxidoreductase subunit A
MYTSTFSFTYNLEYSFEFLLIAFFFSMTLGFVILTLSYFIAIQNPETEKISGYECGFSSFQDARKLFNVQFYIVAILFLIFDLEVVYLFP